MISMMASMSVERPSGQKGGGEFWKEANILLLKSHIWVWTISYCFLTSFGNCCFFHIWFNSIYNYLHCILASAKTKKIQHQQWHNTATTLFHYFMSTNTFNDLHWRTSLNKYAKFTTIQIEIGPQNWTINDNRNFQVGSS